MLDRIEKLARLSVSRACGFAGLGILVFLVGLSSNLPLALKVAGILALIACLVLLLKALHAPRQHYKQTELWIMLRPEERPQQAIAQQVIGTVMRETYFYFALHAGLMAAGLLAVSLVLTAFR
jgi:Ca2+/Na+ antiporter